MTWQIKEGDCLDLMRAMPDASVDSICTDPPYGLSAEPDIAEVLRHWLAGDDYKHRGGGFMGKSWDSFVPGPAVWREAYRVLKPGGHLVAFFGSRTVDLGGIAIRLAGFEIRDQLQWLYGSGFPKSLDVSKAIDKRATENEETTRRIAAVAAVVREYRERAGLTPQQVSMAVVGTPSGACWNWEHQQLPSAEMWPKIKAALLIPDDYDGLIEGDRARFIAAERAVIGLRTTGIGTGNGSTPIIGDSSNRDVTAAATADAVRWEGWGTALKPAHEPIVLARKPLAGTVAASVLAHGTGALNIDGCRIDTQGESWAGNEYAKPSHDAGRWPANVLMDGEAAAMLDGQTGELTSGSGKRRPNEWHGLYEYGGNGASDYDRDGDSGGASRFFYVAKASSAERNAGLDQKPCSCSKIPAWESDEGHAEAIRAASVTSPPRATTAPSSEDDSGSCTTSSGSASTGRSQTGGKSTTATGTSSTTGSEISNSSPPPTTSGSTPRTTGAAPMADGNAAATPAASGSRPTPTTTTSAAKAGPSMADADPVTSGSLSSGSSSAPCADCGGVIEGGRRNVHPLEPTVKPIDVMRWLVRLVTPPLTPDGDRGTVLDPFTGSGTTGIACVLEGFDFIGLERQGTEWAADHPGDDDYIAIADARVRWWAKYPAGTATTAILLESGLLRVAEEKATQNAVARKDDGQTDIFDILGA